MSANAVVTQPHGNGHFEDNKRNGSSLARRWIACCDVVVDVDDDDDKDNDACKNMKKKKKERLLFKARRIPEVCYLQSKIYVPTTILKNLDFPLLKKSRNRGTLTPFIHKPIYTIRLCINSPYNSIVRTS